MLYCAIMGYKKTRLRKPELALLIIVGILWHQSNSGFLVR